MDKLKGCIFRLKMMTYEKNILLSGIMLGLISKKNLIASLHIIIFLKKTKTKSYAEEVSGFSSKETPKLNSNHTCLAVISLDPALNKDGSYYSQGFLKGCKDIKKKVIKHIIDI